MYILVLLNFTPLEFETNKLKNNRYHSELNFTPLEFETVANGHLEYRLYAVKFYSVGV